MMKHEPNSPDNNRSEVKPTFEPLQAEGITGHLKEKMRELDERVNAFPVTAFPEVVQQIIHETRDALNFPVDFTGTSILFAVAVAIGNTHRVKVKSGWTESAALYLALVGRPGTNKSHPLSFATAPLESQDARAFKAFTDEMQRYNELAKISKAQREEQGIEEPKKPVWRQLLVQDFTMEALIEVMKQNPRGVGVCSDELTAWTNNFTRYNKGSEEQFWLSSWSAKPVRTNRKTSDPNFIALPFTPVCGTVQPGVVEELVNGRKENGFMDRLLFAIPEKLKKEAWNDNELNAQAAQRWEAIIDRLLNLPLSYDDDGGIMPHVLQFTPEARKHLFEWQAQLTETANNCDSDTERGIYAKLEVYAVRLALCLELLSWACSGNGGAAVGIDSVKGALQLVEYFRRTALNLHEVMADNSPVRKLSGKEKKVYALLPEVFATGEGVTIAEGAGMPERTFKRFIDRKELFEKLERGQYRKLF